MAPFFFALGGGAGLFSREQNIFIDSGQTLPGYNSPGVTERFGCTEVYLTKWNRPMPL